jgi:predicted nucleic acid-binding protein
VSSPTPWIDALYGGLVGLDSAPLIYLVEAHPTYRSRLQPFFDAVSRGRLRAVTSTVTLVEVLTRPLSVGDTALVARYESLLLDTTGLMTVPLSAVVAREAARLRAVYNLRTPDAVQLATAISEGAGFFLTNDHGLTRVTEIRMLALP